MEPQFGYFGTMGALGLFLLAQFCLDRVYCRCRALRPDAPETPEAPEAPETPEEAPET